MALFAQGSRTRQFATVALIVLPWLLRDQLAVKLDEIKTNAEAVQTAMHDEETRATQAAEQHENRQRLENIERMVQTLVDAKGAPAEDEASKPTDEAEPDAELQALHEEARALQDSVQNLRGYLKQFSAGDFERVQRERLASAEEQKALQSPERQEADRWLKTASVKQGGLSGDELLTKVVPEIEKLVADVLQPDAAKSKAIPWSRWDHAAAALNVAYEDVYAAAGQAQARYTLWADISRWLAWALTAIGALLIGDLARPASGGGDRREGGPAS